MPLPCREDVHTEGYQHLGSGASRDRDDEVSPMLDGDIEEMGLDVHKETIAVAALRPNTVICDERTIANTPEAIRKPLSVIARDPGPSWFRQG